MAIEWSGLSPELLVRLDRSARLPLRDQLQASLREAIRGGRLRAGERLPSSRVLARELGVSRGMIQECYGQLLAEGYLTSHTGSATRVADVRAAEPGGPGAGGPGASPGAGGVSAPGPVGAPSGPSGRSGRSSPPPGPPLIANFEPGVPDLSSF